MDLGKKDLPLTFFIDIDGTTLQHRGTLSNILNHKGVPLPNVVQRIDDWILKGHTIIFVTGRPECLRSKTEKDLLDSGITYHQLIMGVGHGARILINDLRTVPDGPTAAAICVNRDAGFGDAQLP